MKGIEENRKYIEKREQKEIEIKGINEMERKDKKRKYVEVKKKGAME